VETRFAAIWSYRKSPATTWPNGLIGGRQNGFMDDAQLAAQLRDRTRGVDGAQDLFPEAPPNGQDRIVGSHHGFVVGDVFELGASQVSGNLAQIRPPGAVDFRLRRRLLGQDDLAGDVLDIPITQHDGYRKACHQPLQVGGPGQRGLARADEQQLSPEVLAECFGHFLDQVGLLCVTADVLLHLVENDEGQREPAVHGQRIGDRGDQLVVGDVRDLGELGFEQGARRGLRFGESGIGLEQCLGDAGRDVEMG
jgi:hypothetical protein